MKKKMLKDSILVFTTDNGGPAEGYNRNVASNWPLRGVKDTLWEGGVRGAALVWSPWLRSRGRVSHQMMTIQDWLPTLYSAAGGQPTDLVNIDGMDMWPTLADNKPSPRFMLVHNIVEDEIAFRVGNYKLLHTTEDHIYATNEFNDWYGPDGRDDDLPEYDIDHVLASPTGKALASIVRMPSKRTILNLRKQSDIKCDKIKGESPCNQGQVCLFNIKKDPCERDNLISKYKSIAKVNYDS